MNLHPYSFTVRAERQCNADALLPYTNVSWKKNPYVEEDEQKQIFFFEVQI